MERIIKNNLLIILGWALFIICLVMPAISEHGKSATGYMYGMLAIKEIPSILGTVYELKWPIVELSGIGNIFALLSILYIFINKKSTLYILVILSILFLLNNIYYLFNNELGNFEIGFFIWLLSYLSLGSGFLWSVTKKQA